MSVLAHYFEQEGFATTLISLIPIHTEKIEPPRGLAVPFELGRPYGSPSDAEFQKQVLKEQLQLLERPSGPVFEDFADDAPDAVDANWACKVALDPPFENADNFAGMKAALKAELEKVRPAYEKARQRRGKTMVGVSHLGIDMAVNLLISFIEDPSTSAPNPEFPLHVALKLATEDLKAYYAEAAAAEGCDASSKQIADWFWNETTAARVIGKLKIACETCGKKEVADMAWSLAPNGRLP